MATEHRAPTALILILAAFQAAMTLAALLFWLGILVSPSGFSGVASLIGASAVAIFSVLHIPAAVAGILLWQWRRPVLRKWQRVALEASTIYFGLAVLVSIFFNYLAASLIDRIM